MKRILKIFAAFAMSVSMTYCTAPEETAQEPAVPPVVEFAYPEEGISAVVEAPVTFEADITSSGPVECFWAIDDEKIGSTPRVTWTFMETGEYTLHFEAFNEAGTFGKDFAVKVTGVDLVVEFSPEPDTPIGIVMNETITVTATPVSGNRDVVHSWKIGDKEVSTEAVLSYAFDEAGEFTLTYTGTNHYGLTTTASWPVSVDELPLEVEFSENGPRINIQAGGSVEIIATAVNGGSGLVHSWSIDGEKVSEEAEFKRTFADKGVFTLTYSGRNTKGETASGRWVVGVDAFLYDDFEAGTVIFPEGYDGNKNANVFVCSIVDNPYPTDANPSDKVLVDDLSWNNGGTSGYVTIKIDADGEIISWADRKQYTKIAMKVYLGTNDYYPYLQIDLAPTPKSLPSEINGEPFDAKNPDAAAWKRLVKTDDWNVFVYDLVNGNYKDAFADVSEFGQIQFRPLSAIDGSSAPAAIDPVTNTKKVWIDDIQFIE